MEQSNNKKIKNLIKSIIEDSTIHGIPRLLKSNSWISKIAWIIFFCISTSFCLYLIVSSILSFLQYNVVTTIETTNEIPSYLPVITICNLNQLQTNNSFYLVQKYSFMSYLPNEVKNFFLMNEISSFNDSYKKSLSFSSNESILKCNINGITCTESDFVWVFDPIYGNCYSFNSGSNKSQNSVDLIKIKRSGNNNGLRLELFIGNPKNIPEFIETSGYHVMIHNQTYKMTTNEGNVVLFKFYPFCVHIIFYNIRIWRFSRYRNKFCN